MISDENLGILYYLFKIIKESIKKGNLKNIFALTFQIMIKLKEKL